MAGRALRLVLLILSAEVDLCGSVFRELIIAVCFRNTFQLVSLDAAVRLGNLIIADLDIIEFQCEQVSFFFAARYCIAVESAEILERYLCLSIAPADRSVVVHGQVFACRLILDCICQ